MAIDYQDAITTIVGFIATYIGYRGKQMEDRFKASKDTLAEQGEKIVKLETEVKGLRDTNVDIKEDLKTVSFDVKEILRHLRDSK